MQTPSKTGMKTGHVACLRIGDLCGSGTVELCGAEMRVHGEQLHSSPILKHATRPVFIPVFESVCMRNHQK